jgi:hypothetical protein
MPCYTPHSTSGGGRSFYAGHRVTATRLTHGVKREAVRRTGYEQIQRMT